MGWGDLVDIVWGWIVAVYNAMSYYLSVVWSYLTQLVDAINTALQYVVNCIKWVGRHLWSGIQALRHLNFGAIWHALKRAYSRIHRALDWYQRRVLGPIDRIRRQIWDIYRRFFKPILQVLDSFRVMVRIIAIFNRSLAAQLDARLMWLESKLMYPITAVLKRLNEVSSYIRAIITQLGFLDRVLLLESLRRDASLVWQVLTNPLGRLHTDPPGITHQSLAQLDADFQMYARAGAGPLAEQVDQLDQTFAQARAELGV